MPSSYEMISRSQHGDYTQTMKIETEEGSLHISISGPAGLFELEIESPDDLPAQARQLDQLAAALADACAALAPLLDSVEGGQP
jgi:hypothetical protein